MQWTAELTAKFETDSDPKKAYAVLRQIEDFAHSLGVELSAHYLKEHVKDEDPDDMPSDGGYGG